MDSKLKPKVFGPVFVTFDGKDEIQYALSDPSDISLYPPISSPVDTLIASLGSCIVKSVQWSADQRKVKLNPFTVTLTGTKALDLPGRVERIDVEITGNLVDDSALVPRIVKQAKSICTVSNTLTCEVSVVIQAEMSS